jgi:hypothetical protein
MSKKIAAGKHPRLEYMLVSYSSDSEVIVSTLAAEEELIRLYFTEGGRDLESYDREVAETLEVSSRCKVNAY